MNIDRRLMLMGMAGAGAAAVTSEASAQSAPKRARSRAGQAPNILMIVTDQEMGVPSYPKGLLDHLPGHRELLKMGVHVPGYHVHTTPCSPSRSTIYTGQHTQHTKIFYNTNMVAGMGLSQKMPTIGTMLRRAGYYTAYKGKWHLHPINGDRNFNREATEVFPDTTNVLEPYGFSDYYFDGEELGLTWAGFQSDRVIAGDASKWLSDAASGEKTGGKPWFLAVNLINPHDIMFYDATGRQAETRAVRNRIGVVQREPGDPLYAENLKLPLPRSFYLDDLSTKPDAHRAIVELANRFYGAMPRGDEQSWLRFANYYFNCMRDMDRNILTLLWALKRTGQLENTAIVYSSDHGERCGAHGLRQKAATMYREETNVPMFIVHPAARGGSTSKALMSAIDIAPTLLGLAGKDAAWQRENFPALKGVDVSGAIFDSTVKTERDRRGHLFNYATMSQWAPLPPGSTAVPPFDLSKRRLHRGVFDGRYKFARYFAPAQHHTPRDWATLTARNDLELYDTRADPDEIRNLAHQPEPHKELIMKLNGMVNDLVDLEIGVDDGSEYPGPAAQYKTI